MSKKRFKRQRVENQIERMLAIGMIVSTEFLREIQTIYNPDFIEIPYVKTIATWCLDYLDAYDKAPGKHIQDMFNAHVRKDHVDDNLAELIGDFLSGISVEHERSDKFNIHYTLDKIEERFQTKNLNNLAEDIQIELQDGNVLEATALIGKHKQVARVKGTAINPFNNINAIKSAFESGANPLFKFPGEYGRMVNDQLVRDGFIALMGKGKIGKTFQLQEFCFRALKYRCNAAFFQVGDQSEDDMTLRQHIRLAGRHSNIKYCGEILIPTLDCESNQDDSCTLKRRKGTCGLNSDGSAPLQYTPCSVCDRTHPRLFNATVWYKERPPVKPLTWREGYKLGTQFMRHLKGKNYKLSTHANNSINIQGIRSQLDIWEHFEGWVPDVVIIDYADILKPEPNTSNKDERYQINEQWKAMRRLSQERHCLLITATQTDAAAYESPKIRLGNFSSDRRKVDHVTGLIGLNQTDEEKERGILRCNWLALRQGEFDQNKQVAILQCLQIGNPHLGSYLYKYNEDDDED